MQNDFNQRSLFDQEDSEEQLEQIRRIAMGKEGERLKQEGTARVLCNTNNDWKDGVAKIIYEMPTGSEFTGEDIRFKAISVVGYPKHHNAWGAVIRTARVRKYIVPTGEWVNSVDPRSHARATLVYRRT